MSVWGARCSLRPAGSAAPTGTGYGDTPLDARNVTELDFTPYDAQNRRTSNAERYHRCAGAPSTFVLLLKAEDWRVIVRLGEAPAKQPFPRR
jgi:hypothetical protein